MEQEKIEINKKELKNNKKIYFLIIGIVLLLAIGFGLFFRQDIADKLEDIKTSESSDVVEESPALSERVKKFSISGKSESGPQFVEEVTIDPFTVKIGEVQYFTIWIEDPIGIEKTTLEIETEDKPEITDMELIEGSPKKGKWIGYWTAKNLFEEDYHLAIFRATNRKGEERKMNILWEYDVAERQSVFHYFFPTALAYEECVFNNPGDTTISSTCEVSGNETAGGNLTVIGSDTIVLLKQDSALGVDGGDLTLEDGSVIQMIEQSVLSINNGAFRNNDGRILMDEDIRIIFANCQCEPGDECCSDGCNYDSSETVCWTGEWSKECDWDDDCAETSDGTMTRNYKTCSEEGSCFTLQTETEDAICFRDTTDDLCWTGPWGPCTDCFYGGGICDETGSFGEKWRDVKYCEGGTCSRESSDEGSCTCKRDTDGVVCLIKKIIMCSSGSQCNPCPSGCEATETCEYSCSGGSCSDHADSCSWSYDNSKCCVDI